jgi:hypothetical protein
MPPDSILCSVVRFFRLVRASPYTESELGGQHMVPV